MKTKEKMLNKAMLCISKKAETPKEKYLQLKKDFENLTTDAERMMQITIRHALKQSTAISEYSGFAKDFWIAVMSEYLAQNFSTSAKIIGQMERMQ